MSDSSPSLPDALPVAASLPSALLELLPTGVVYYVPVHNAAGEVVDFMCAYLNASARRALGLPAQPTLPFTRQFPESLANGAFACCQATWHAKGAPGYLELPCHANGQRHRLRAVARHAQEGLLITFSDPTDHPPSAAENALAGGPAHPDQLHPAAYGHPHEQLQQQHALLQQIMGQVPASIATLVGPAHRYAYFNESYQALSGGRTQLGLTVAEVFPEVVEQGFIGLLDGVYATGKPFIGVETPAQLLDSATGEPVPRFVDFIYQPLTDEQNRTQGVLAFVVDVTEKVQARRQAEELRAQVQDAIQRQVQAREVLYQIFEHTPALVQLLRAPGHRIDYVNPAYQRLFAGRPLVGLDLVQALPELREAGFIDIMDKVYRTGEAYFGVEMPFTVPPAAGQPARDAYFTFTYQAYRENGQIAGLSVFALEVTEQVLARREREAQQAELQRIFEQAPVAIAIMRGPDLIIELANSTMRAIWGRPAEQLLGRPNFEAVPDTAGQGFEEILAGVLATGEPFYLNEAPARLDRAHTGQPTHGYFNFVFQPLRDEQQQVSGLIAIGTEVTEQVTAREQVLYLNEKLAVSNQALLSANEELGVANTQLVRTNTDLDTFVYTASHDLKAPITNIEGLLLALRDELPADAQQAPVVARIFDLIQNAVVRFQQTIVHLADVAQLQETQEADSVDLAALVTDVRLDLAPLLEATHATLSVHLDPGAATVRIAFKTLRSVVYNLLSNALKYRHPDRLPVVELRASCAAGRVSVAVHDNGLGLTAAQQQELFGMFRRLHTHVEGSGVGLFMVKRMVENAGGTIEVQSQAGIGSTFTVSLPV